MKVDWLTIVVLSSVVIGVMEASKAGAHKHRRHHHSTKNGTSLASAAGELKQNLQSSPKDALIVTKRRYLRQDWCQSQPLIQRISQDQCLSTTILNRFCYGQCNSFYIPKNQLKADDGSGPAPASAFKSCAVCQPKKTSWTTVTLKCPSLVPNIRRRRVQIVHQCRCVQPQDSPF